MKKNQIIATVILFFTVLLVIGAIALGVSVFSGRDFNLFFETEGEFTYNGLIFLEKNGERALCYRPLGRTFEDLEKREVDLGLYGYEGSFPYFAVDGVLISPDTAYEGFWPVSSEERFVYLNGEEKIRIDTERQKAYPVFADSVEGVDPAGKEVLAFSSSGIFALSLRDGVATVFVSDSDAASTKVERVETIDLNGYGTKLFFHAFVNERSAFFSAERDGKRLFLALDCGTMNVVETPLPDAEYGALLSRVFLERFPTEKEAQDEKNLHLGWTNCLLGTAYSASLPKEIYQSAALLSVSPQGNYAIAEATRRDGGREKLVLSQKKAYSFSEKEADFEVEELFFAYDNILFAVLRSAEGKAVSRGYKICY